MSLAAHPFTESEMGEISDKFEKMSTSQNPRQEYMSGELSRALASGPSQDPLMHRNPFRLEERGREKPIQAKLVNLVGVKRRESKAETTMEDLKTVNSILIQDNYAHILSATCDQLKLKKTTVEAFEKFGGLEVFMHVLQSSPMLPEAMEEIKKIFKEGEGELTEGGVMRATNCILEGTQLSLKQALHAVDEMLLNGDIKHKDHAAKIKKAIQQVFNQQNWITPKQIQHIIKHTPHH